MKKALGVTLALVFIVFVAFFLFKNKPNSVGVSKVINPTYFENKAKIGRVISRRFYTEFKDAKLIILGSSAQITDYNKIWYELIKASLVDGIAIENFISVKGLQPLTQNDLIIEDLEKIERGSGLTVLQVPSNDYWRDKVLEAYPNADYIFFQAPFSMQSEGQKKLGLGCKTLQDESFACLAYRAGTRYYRKRREENRLTVMMEQSENKYYMLYIGEKY